MTDKTIERRRKKFLASVKNEMEIQGIDQSDIENITRLMQPFISRTLNEGNPKLDTLLKITGALNCDIVLKRNEPGKKGKTGDTEKNDGINFRCIFCEVGFSHKKTLISHERVCRQEVH